jgi:hypothetical protein
MSMIHQLAAFVAGAKYEFFWGYLLATWLWGVILNLFLVPGFYGIALGNLGLILGIPVLVRFSNRTRNSVLVAAHAVAKQR